MKAPKAKVSPSPLRSDQYSLSRPLLDSRHALLATLLTMPPARRAPCWPRQPCGGSDALSVMATVDLMWVGLPTDARPNHPAECERLLHAKRASGHPAALPSLAFIAAGKLPTQPDRFRCYNRFRLREVFKLMGGKLQSSRHGPDELTERVFDNLRLRLHASQPVPPAQPAAPGCAAEIDGSPLPAPPRMRAGAGDASCPAEASGSEPPVTEPASAEERPSPPAARVGSSSAAASFAAGSCGEASRDEAGREAGRAGAMCAALSRADFIELVLDALLDPNPKPNPKPSPSPNPNPNPNPNQVLDALLELHYTAAEAPVRVRVRVRAHPTRTPALSLARPSCTSAWRVISRSGGAASSSSSAAPRAPTLTLSLTLTSP